MKEIGPRGAHDTSSPSLRTTDAFTKGQLPKIASGISSFVPPPTVLIFQSDFWRRNIKNAPPPLGLENPVFNP